LCLPGIAFTERDPWGADRQYGEIHPGWLVGCVVVVGAGVLLGVDVEVLVGGGGQTFAIAADGAAAAAAMTSRPVTERFMLRMVLLLLDGGGAVASHVAGISVLLCG
jgi:hypothetical protein